MAYTEPMPTVFMVNGFRIEIFKGDHEPPHVHASKGRSRAKINLDPVTVDFFKNVSRSDLKRVRAFILEHHRELLKAWETHNG